MDCILLARKTGSAPLFQQMLGRGSRLHEEKHDCLVIDFKRNFERLFDGMMNAQDELDEVVNNKKRSAKKTGSAKNAGKAGLEENSYGMWLSVCSVVCILTCVCFDLVEDSLVTVNHYSNLQDMMERRRLEKGVKVMLATPPVAAEKKKSKNTAAPIAPSNQVLKPSLSDKIYK